MEKIGFVLIGAVVLLWIIGMIAGLIALWPYGLPILIGLAGVGFLLAKAIKDRLSSEEDKYYSKHVEK